MKLSQQAQLQQKGFLFFQINRPDLRQLVLGIIELAIICFPEQAYMP